MLVIGSLARHCLVIGWHDVRGRPQRVWQSGASGQALPIPHRAVTADQNKAFGEKLSL